MVLLLLLLLLLLALLFLLLLLLLSLLTSLLSCLSLSLSLLLLSLSLLLLLMKRPTRNRISDFREAGVQRPHRHRYIFRGPLVWRRPAPILKLLAVFSSRVQLVPSSDLAATMVSRLVCMFSRRWEHSSTCARS